jgi:hypothetical protein
VLLLLVYFTKGVAQSTIYPSISSEVLDSFADKAPNPAEMSLAFKKKYNKKIVYLGKKDFEKSEIYKVANIGRYCAILMYIVIHQKNKELLNCLVRIKELSDNIYVGQYFEYQQIRAKLENKNGVDSISILAKLNLQEVNNRWSQNNKNELIPILILGVWLETTYIILDEIEKKSLVRFLVTQKNTLEQLIELLNYYDQVPDIKLFIKQLEDIHKTLEESDLENSTILRTKSFQKISNKISVIRNKIIN